MSSDARQDQEFSDKQAGSYRSPRMMSEEDQPQFRRPTMDSTSEPPAESGATYSERQLFQDETREIQHRRTVAGFEPQNIGEIRESLVGLTLSGGGARSAAQSLGFLMSLGRTGLLRVVDFGRAISGGSFALLMLMLEGNRRPDRTDGPVFRFARSQEEPIRSGYPRRVRRMFESPDYLRSDRSYRSRLAAGTCLTTLMYGLTLVGMMSLLAYLWRIPYGVAVGEWLSAFGFSGDVWRAVVPACLITIVWIACWVASILGNWRRARGWAAHFVFLIVVPAWVFALATLWTNGDIGVNDLLARNGVSEEQKDSFFSKLGFLHGLFITAAVASLIPLFNFSRLLRSTRDEANVAQRFAFRMARLAVLYGLPLFVFAFMVREDVSGWNLRRDHRLVRSELETEFPLDRSASQTRLLAIFDSEVLPAHPDLLRPEVSVGKESDEKKESEDENPESTKGGDSSSGNVKDRVARYLWTGNGYVSAASRNEKTQYLLSTLFAYRGALSARLTSEKDISQSYASVLQGDREPLARGDVRNDGFSVKSVRSVHNLSAEIRRVDRLILYVLNLRLLNPRLSDLAKASFEAAPVPSQPEEPSRSNVSDENERIGDAFPFADPAGLRRALRRSKRHTGNFDKDKKDDKKNLTAIEIAIEEEIGRLIDGLNHRLATVAEKPDIAGMLHAVSLPKDSETLLKKLDGPLAAITESLDSRVDLLRGIEINAANTTDANNDASVAKEISQASPDPSTESQKKDSDSSLIAALKNLAASRGIPSNASGFAEHAEIQAYVRRLLIGNRMLLESLYPDTIKPKGSTVYNMVVYTSDQHTRLVTAFFCLVPGLLLLCVGDLNFFSLHSFYAQALQRYWLQAGRDERVTPVAFESLWPKPQAAWLPLPLVGASVLTGDNETDPVSDPPVEFLLSPLACGSDNPAVGLVKTRATDLGQLQVGDVAALSGAAITPQATPNPLLRTMLVIANLRLGLWLRPPRLTAGGRVAPRPTPREKVGAGWSVPFWPPICWFAHKLMLLMTEIRPRRVLVVDGGHVDNLGAAALFRRRCKVVIAVDASHDPNFNFASLEQSMALAREQQEVEFLDPRTGLPASLPWELVPSEKKERKKDEAGKSEPTSNAPLTSDRRIAFFLVDYGPASAATPSAAHEDADFRRHERFGDLATGLSDLAAVERMADNPRYGLFCYVKSTVLATDPIPVMQRQRQEPAFPHDSTSDQFLHADKLESYRALGEAAGDCLAAWLAPEVFGADRTERLPEWQSSSSFDGRGLFRLMGRRLLIAGGCLKEEVASKRDDGEENVVSDDSVQQTPSPLIAEDLLSEPLADTTDKMRPSIDRLIEGVDNLARRLVEIENQLSGKSEHPTAAPLVELDDILREMKSALQSVSAVRKVVPSVVENWTSADVESMLVCLKHLSDGDLGRGALPRRAGILAVIAELAVSGYEFGDPVRSSTIALVGEIYGRHTRSSKIAQERSRFFEAIELCSDPADESLANEHAEG